LNTIKKNRNYITSTVSSHHPKLRTLSLEFVEHLPN